MRLGGGWTVARAELHQDGYCPRPGYLLEHPGGGWHFVPAFWANAPAYLRGQCGLLRRSVN